MIDCRPAINMSVLKRRGGGISRVTKKEGPFAESTMQKGQIINNGGKLLLYRAFLRVKGRTASNTFGISSHFIGKNLPLLAACRTLDFYCL
jgi:hypothetical protein